MRVQEIGDKWQAAFMQAVMKLENAGPLKEAALQERLKNWTEVLTRVVVSACEDVGWRATAKGHRLGLFPIAVSEYLALDVMAFPRAEKQWPFPVAVFELENGKSDSRIAYSLWKVLCVNTNLRVVFCYRRNLNESSSLIRFLRDEVVHAMDLAVRTGLVGQTIVVVGGRDEWATFPYGFFKWWFLDNNTGKFELA